MKPFIPARYSNIAFALLLSAMMSFMVSGIATLVSVGPSARFFGEWILAWLPSWLFAFPAVLVVAPIVRTILNTLVIDEAE